MLKEINKQAQKQNRTINCLLQVHIAEEETKFGLNKTELIDILNSEEYKNMSNINVVGLMGMATFTTNVAQVRKEFKTLKTLFEDTKAIVSTINTLSMGMSGDYKIAIEEGSTMVRIGSSIFGSR